MGLALVIAAYFTRSAGLPLLVAVALWLALRRRWRPLGVLAGVFLVPAALWQSRSQADYISEFWLINPYAPDLGRAGPGDLIARGRRQLLDVRERIRAGGAGRPRAVRGPGSSASCWRGWLVAGWVRRVRGGPGVAELFFILYAGLMLAWPAVWSGDRFALPLFPLLLLYAGETLAGMAGKLSAAARERPAWLARLPARAIVLAVAGATLVPASFSWASSAATGRCGAPSAWPGWVSWGAVRQA